MPRNLMHFEPVQGRRHAMHCKEAQLLEVHCPLCGEESVIRNVRSEDLAMWLAGGLIQDCFSWLTPAQRELIQTGTCSTCWSKIFGDIEDEAPEITELYPFQPDE